MAFIVDDSGNELVDDDSNLIVDSSDGAVLTISTPDRGVGFEPFSPSRSYDQSWRHRPEAFRAEYWPHLPSGEPDGPGVPCRAEIDRDASGSDSNQVAQGTVTTVKTASFLIWAPPSAVEPAPGVALQVLQGPHAGWWTIGIVSRARYGPRWRIDAYGVPRASNDTE